MEKEQYIGTWQKKTPINVKQKKSSRKCSSIAKNAFQKVVNVTQPFMTIGLVISYVPMDFIQQYF